MLCPGCGYYTDRDETVCPECGAILNASAGAPETGAEAIRDVLLFPTLKTLGQ